MMALLESQATAASIVGSEASEEDSASGGAATGGASKVASSASIRQALAGMVAEGGLDFNAVSDAISVLTKAKGGPRRGGRR